MKIVASGWGRNCGKRKLFSGDITKSYTSSEMYSDNTSISYLDGVTLLQFKVSIEPGSSMGGNYHFRLSLSREEVIHLFWSTFRRFGLAEVTALIAEALNRDQALIRAHPAVRRYHDAHPALATPKIHLVSQEGSDG